MLTAISEADQPSSKASNVVPVYQPKHYPFDGGERLVYHASWNGLFSVATATVHTTSEWVDGQKFYNVRVEASSSKLLDFIWKMRDTITSKINANGLTPTHFTFSQRENRKVIDTVASFDRTTKRWSVHRDEREKVKRYQFDQPNNTLDVITAVYLARSLDFKVGDHLYFHIFGGKYRYLLDLQVECKETIRLKSGNIEAFKFVPRIEDVLQEGYATRLNEAAVWISAACRSCSKARLFSAASTLKSRMIALRSRHFRKRTPDLHNSARFNTIPALRAIKMNPVLKKNFAVFPVLDCDSRRAHPDKGEQLVPQRFLC